MHHSVAVSTLAMWCTPAVNGRVSRVLRESRPEEWFTMLCTHTSYSVGSFYSMLYMYTIGAASNVLN